MASRKLNSFLKAAKIAATSLSSHNIIHIVLGNQASDADSIISSLCHAYFAQQRNNSANISYVPAICIPRAEIHFRREVKLLLELVDLDLDDLICLEEIPVDCIQKKGILEVSLTDHNVLDQKLEELMSSSIKSIIDHHCDCGMYPWVTGLDRNVAFDVARAKASVGSACTLVAENYLQARDGSEGVELDANVAILLMAVILLE